MSEIKLGEFLAGCKGYLMQVTSISHYPKEMEVIDNILLKMWQAGLLDKDSIIDRIEPSPNENTPRNTKVYVRDSTTEPWQEAYFSDVVWNNDYNYKVYVDTLGCFCERRDAWNVTGYKYCKLAQEKSYE